VLQSSPDLKKVIWRYDCNGRKSSTAVIEYKKNKLNVSIEVPKAELFIEEELLGF
jgi:hypothetical protein